MFAIYRRGGVQGNSSPWPHCPCGSHSGFCTWELRGPRSQDRLLGARATPPSGPRPHALGGEAPGRPPGAGGGGGSASASRQRLSPAGSERGAQSPAQPGAQKQRQALSSDQPGSSRRRGRRGRRRRRGRWRQLKSSRPGYGQLQVAAPLASGPWVKWPTGVVAGLLGTAPRWSGLPRCQGRWARESAQDPLQTVVPSRDYVTALFRATLAAATRSLRAKGRKGPWRHQVTSGLPGDLPG